MILYSSQITGQRLLIREGVQKYLPVVPRYFEDNKWHFIMSVSKTVDEVLSGALEHSYEIVNR